MGTCTTTMCTMVPRDHGTINSILFPGILGLFRHEDTPSIPFQNTTAQVPVREYRILPSIAGDQSTELVQRIPGYI